MTSASIIPFGEYGRLGREDRASFRRDLRETLMLPKNRTPTERQMYFLLATFNRTMRQPVFYGGAMGGAKTAALCMAAISMARMIPKNRVLMCRKHFSAFTASTLQELEEQVDACPDATHWPGKHEIHFTNGSEIWYMGVGTAQQRQKLGSTQFGGILADEATEIEWEIMKTLQTRLRWKPAANGKRLVLAMAGNPFPGWIKQDFVSAPKPGYSFIPARADDNPHLYDGYVDDMRVEMPDEWYKAFILGDWDAMMPTNSIVPAHLITAAKRRREAPDYYNVVWGIDLGHMGTDLTVIAERAGNHFETVSYWNQKRVDESAVLICNEVANRQYLPRKIVFDYDGIGAGVADIIMGKQEAGEFPPSIVIVGVHAQKPAEIVTRNAYAAMRYANVKAQNAFAFRRLLESNHGDIPADDADLDEDLGAANYNIVDGKVFVESKKLVRQKLGRSPDRGDAYFLTMYDESGDEIAGLPPDLDALAQQYSSTEEAELVTIAGRSKLRSWYSNPFGEIAPETGPVVIDIDPDLGY